MDGALGRMDSMIDDLLTLSREEKVVTDRETADISTIVAGCWRNVDTVDAAIETEIDQESRSTQGREDRPTVIEDIR